MADNQNELFAAYIAGARTAVQDKPTQLTIFAMAQYLDLVTAKEIVSDFKLTQECRAVIAQFVAAHVANPAYVSFWERADCLFKVYKRALKQAEAQIAAPQSLVNA